MSAYETSLQHLLAELARLDLLVRAQVWRARQQHRNDEDKLSAFYIPEAEPDALLDRALGEPTWAATPLPPQMHAALQTKLDALAQELAQRTDESLHRGLGLRLVMLGQAFNLAAFDLDVILICLAPELDRRYERLYAYLQDDVTRKLPCVDLVLNLLCPQLEAKVAARARLRAAAPLLQFNLLQLNDEAGPRAPSLISKTMQLDARIARYLLSDDASDDEPDERLKAYAALVVPQASVDDLIFPAAFKTQLSELLVHAIECGDDLIVYWQGGYGLGKQSAAEACGRAMGAPLLVVDGRQLAALKADAFETLVRLIDREARLQAALIYWRGFDALLAEDKAAHLAFALSILGKHPGPTFLAGEAAWEPSDALHDCEFVRLAFPQPGYEQRLQLWQAALGNEALGNEVDDEAEFDLVTVASKFRLSGGQIYDAAATARNLALARNPAAPKLAQADLSAACRLQSNRKLAELAQHITPHYGWGDIVLPADPLAQLHEIYNQMQYRALVYETWGFERKLAMGKGLNVLFAGPPGTGKTMAADILAHALGLDLYKIDLSAVLSKYIGETEKNLARIFDEARSSNAILFFDEADALFGKRTQVQDAHDRYANVEISYLLQKMEEYEGMVILATNLRKNMDEAFVRRLHFGVDFPMPSVDERRLIWQQIWPAAAPRDPALDLEFMAQRIEVSGGNIRNIALAGAFLAAANGGVVTMQHLIHATQREYQKMGKVLVAREFGEYQ
jgi:ATPase family associated with various cellular activities (AAA)